jgi:uncharacterized protein YwqG
MAKKKYSIVSVGGFRPTGDAFATHFGMTPLAGPEEEWPEEGGKPLMFVCQLNLTNAPVVPPQLSDIQLITFFVEPETAELGDENGTNWVLRAYKSLDGLAPLTRPEGAPKVRKGFECRWEESGDAKAARTKIGGKPAEIQSEPWWDYRQHPANPEYCVQINSEEKAGVFFGAGGTVYLARGTAPGCGDKWFLDLQMF